MDTFEPVVIDPEGTFKYIQIEVTKDGESTLVIRGSGSFDYHMEIFENFVKQEIKEKGIKNTTADCPGGGRIKHNPDDKEIFVYGYSQSYGLADHSKTVEMLKEKYPDYNIDWSNEGY